VLLGLGDRGAEMLHNEGTTTLDTSETVSEGSGSSVFVEQMRRTD
jgi:hypothetical protein